LYIPYDYPTPEAGQVGRLTPDCTDDTSAVRCDDIELLTLLSASTTQSTRRAYESDLRHFAAWGGPLPATPLDVARYLAAHAGRLSVATLARRLVAIGQVHAVRGLADPTKTDLVQCVAHVVRTASPNEGPPSLEALGIESDFCRVGVPQEGVAPLRKVMRDSLSLLNETRCEQWRATRNQLL